MRRKCLWYIGLGLAIGWLTGCAGVESHRTSDQTPSPARQVLVGQEGQKSETQAQPPPRDVALTEGPRIKVVYPPTANPYASYSVRAAKPAAPPPPPTAKPPDEVIQVGGSEQKTAESKQTALSVISSGLSTLPPPTGDATEKGNPAAAAPRPIELQKPALSPVAVALEHLRNHRPAEALAVLKQYDNATQELLICLLALTTRLGEDNLSNPDEVKVLIDQLQGLIDQLRPRAALVLDKMRLCEWIRSFGHFKLAPGTYHPGDPVDVYVELRNFTCTDHNGQWETRLASTITLKDQNDHVVELLRDPIRPDCSQTLLHDFFSHYRFELDRRMEPGTYKLCIKVTDVPTGRTAEQAIDLRVVPRPNAE